MSVLTKTNTTPSSKIMDEREEHQIMLHRARSKKQMERLKEKRSQKLKLTEKEKKAKKVQRHKIRRTQLRTMSLTQYAVMSISHKYWDITLDGLESLRCRIDRNYRRNDGKERMIDDSLFYFGNVSEALRHGVLGAVCICLKKHIDNAEITLSALNLLSVLIEGRTWYGEGLISDADDVIYFEMVKRRSAECDLLNVVLLIVENKCTKSSRGDTEILMEALSVLEKLVLPVIRAPASYYENALIPAYLGEPIVDLKVNMDAGKEFIVVDAIECRLNIKERGSETCGVVTSGCMVLHAFVRLFPHLRRHSTCKIIHRLLVDVYSLFEPYPYHFCAAIPVLEELLKSDDNFVHFQHRSPFIYKFVTKYNQKCSQQMTYKDLESRLLTLMRKFESTIS